LGTQHPDILNSTSLLFVEQNQLEDSTALCKINSEVGHHDVALRDTPTASVSVSNAFTAQGSNSVVTRPLKRTMSRAKHVAPSPERVTGKELLQLHSLLAAHTNDARTLRPVFILDSGASSHMTPLKCLLVDSFIWGGSVSLGDTSVKLKVQRNTERIVSN
jgi:hypothetical protein